MVHNDIPPIRIVRLSHMRYAHADIKQASTFLEDFGLKQVFSENDGKTLYFAGEGPDAFCYVAEEGEKSEYLGGAFLVETRADLERASQILPHASQLLPAGPAGGYRVTFRDPDNIPVSLVWGLDSRKDEHGEIVPAINYPREKPRKGTFRRFKQGPSPVYKLGHFGLLVSDFKKTYEFYTTYFNLKATDILTVQDDFRVAAFMHVDREEEWVDHHTFFFSMNPIKTGPHHCSFEVHDPDVQAIGHNWLVAKGYESAWGVGRHVLGSQVFDYWFTPDDFMVEHYSDGDLVNCHTETGVLPASDEALAIWGPAVPEGFHMAMPEKQMKALKGAL